MFVHVSAVKAKGSALVSILAGAWRTRQNFRLPCLRELAVRISFNIRLDIEALTVGPRVTFNRNGPGKGSDRAKTIKPLRESLSEDMWLHHTQKNLLRVWNERSIELPQFKCSAEPQEIEYLSIIQKTSFSFEDTMSTRIISSLAVVVLAAQATAVELAILIKPLPTGKLHALQPSIMEVVSVGDTFDLDCYLYPGGNPDEVVTWYHNGRRFRGGSNAKVIGWLPGGEHQDYQIRFFNFSVEHGGEYTCITSSKGNVSGVLAGEQTFTLICPQHRAMCVSKGAKYFDGFDTPPFTTFRQLGLRKLLLNHGKLNPQIKMTQRTRLFQI